MKVSKVEVTNYRLLKDFSVDLEDDLSLIIGKNNSGKTSLLTLLENFLSTEKAKIRFCFHDLNSDEQQDFKVKFDAGNFESDATLGFQMRLHISYSEGDSLRNISNFFVNLDPERNVLVLEYSYEMSYGDISRLKDDYRKFTEVSEVNKEKTVIDYLNRFHKDYFHIRRRSVNPDNDDEFLEIKDAASLDKVISFKYIKAKRDIDNTEATVMTKASGTLSRLSAQYFNKESKTAEANPAVDKLRSTVASTDKTFTEEVYPEVFKPILDRVKKYGGIVPGESIVEVVSAIKEDRILSDNTTVSYKQGDHRLPEEYNGLGYLNLISIIFEIEVILNDFKKKYDAKQRPADINILFVEEPEAHTHPQMQYIFIRNIKALLAEAKSELHLQTVVSTHSSHIVAESDFSDIKYFSRAEPSSVVSKNLSALEAEYGEDSKQYAFLKQYLTLTSGELFFANKAVLIEGDTERLLLPTMMRKLDFEKQDDDLPLLSQNISVVEVGAYVHIFEKFIDFLDVKTLVITDIDSNDGSGPCRVAEGSSTTNSAINFFFNGTSFADLLTLERVKRTFTKDKADMTWKQNANGNLYLAYQEKESGMASKEITGRSFEEAFIHINHDFVVTLKDNEDSRSIKNAADFDDTSKDAYDLAESCIKKKTYFALDILYNSDSKFSNWKIPSYIQEGLLWLKKS